jgi:hypothetical protein
MPTFNAVFPLPAGKLDAARSFAKELNGPRRQQLEDLQRHCGVEREIWSIQEMPAGGHAILVLFDGDVDRTFTELANGSDEFTTWYRAQVLDIGGPDLTSDDQPASEVIFEWSAS